MKFSLNCFKVMKLFKKHFLKISCFLSKWYLCITQIFVSYCTTNQGSNFKIKSRQFQQRRSRINSKKQAFSAQQEKMKPPCREIAFSRCLKFSLLCYKVFKIKVSRLTFNQKESFVSMQCVLSPQADQSKDHNSDMQALPCQPHTSTFSSQPWRQSDLKHPMIRFFAKQPVFWFSQSNKCCPAGSLS